MLKVNIKHLRKSFGEIINLLKNLNIDYWIGRDLVWQVSVGVIDDDEENHDIDFHILERDKTKLLNYLQKNDYNPSLRDYKIQILAKTDSRRIEFVFLKNHNDNEFIQQSKGKSYISPKYIFGNRKIKIDGIIVRTPWPLETYVKYCCVK